MTSNENTQNHSANNAGFQDIAAFPFSEEEYEEILRDGMAHGYDLFADLVYNEDWEAPAMDQNALAYGNQDEGQQPTLFRAAGCQNMHSREQGNQLPDLDNAQFADDELAEDAMRPPAYCAGPSQRRHCRQDRRPSADSSNRRYDQPEDEEEATRSGKRKEDAARARQKRKRAANDSEDEEEQEKENAPKTKNPKEKAPLIPPRMAGVPHMMKFNPVVLTPEDPGEVTEDEAFIHTNGEPTQVYYDDQNKRTLKWVLENYNMVEGDKAQFAAQPGELRSDLPPPDNSEWGIQNYLVAVKGFPLSTTLEDGIQYLQDQGNEEQWKFKAWAEGASQRQFQLDFHHYPNAHRREKDRKAKKAAGVATKSRKTAKPAKKKLKRAN